MWNQLSFWALMGPKHLRRFVLILLVVMGVVFYAFVQDAFDGESSRPHPPRMPSPARPVR
jgi:hypothetical protein